MNDNQYIAHGAVICHSGVKGMKWGKHLKAASNWIDENITGKSAQAEAEKWASVARAHQNLGNQYAQNAEKYAERGNKSERIGKFASVFSKDQVKDHQRTSALGAADRAIASSNNQKRFQEEQKMRQADAKRASAQRRANKSLFGKAKTIFGKPKLSMIVRR